MVLAFLAGNVGCVMLGEFVPIANNADMLAMYCQHVFMDVGNRQHDMHFGQIGRDTVGDMLHVGDMSPTSSLVLPTTCVQ